MDPGFWEVVTAVGVIATALATSMFGYLHYRNSTLYNLPGRSIRRGTLLDGSAWIDFEIKNAEGRPDWEVISANVRRNWRRRRVLCDGNIEWVEGHPSMWTPESFPFDLKERVSWDSRIAYDPPTTQVVVLVHPDAPDCSISFNICLSSAPSNRSSFVTRYKARE